jgi:hypothetical protein
MAAKNQRLAVRSPSSLLNQTLGFAAEPWAAACEALAFVALIVELDDTPRHALAIGVE